MRQNTPAAWRTQANLYQIERKLTGETVNGEPTYYYEKSFCFPGGERQVLLEDREAHSATRPFCLDTFCPCHWEDQENILRLTQMVKEDMLTNAEARAIFSGQSPMPTAQSGRC